MQGFNEERPPYVKFERRPIEKRQLAPPAGDGSIFYVDTDFAIITPQGTKNIVEKQVDDWFAYLQQMVLQGRYNPVWLSAFKGAYNDWKNGQDVPINGQALKNWPAITPSELRKLSDMHIYSVEDLAAATEEAMEQMGMGGRSLKKRAQDWLQGKKDLAPLVTELDTLRVSQTQMAADIQELRTLTMRLQTENDFLRGQAGNQGTPQLAPALPPLEERLAAAQASLPATDDILSRL